MTDGRLILRIGNDSNHVILVVKCGSNDRIGEPVLKLNDSFCEGAAKYPTALRNSNPGSLNSLVD